MKWLTCEGVVDNEGDEFFDASTEPSSPSFLSRAASRGSGRLPFADKDTDSVASRASSFKDAPGPSELWQSQDQGERICLWLEQRTLIKCTVPITVMAHHAHAISHARPVEPEEWVQVVVQQTLQHPRRAAPGCLTLTHGHTPPRAMLVWILRCGCGWRRCTSMPIGPP